MSREAPDERAVARAEVGSSVEVFDEPEVARIGASRAHLTLERAIGAVGENAVQDYGEYEVQEHLHDESPSTRSAVVAAHV